MTGKQKHPGVVIAEATERLRNAGNELQKSVMEFTEAMKANAGWVTGEHPKAPAKQVQRQAVQSLQEIPADLLMATAMILSTTWSEAETQRLTTLLLSGPRLGPRGFALALATLIATVTRDQESSRGGRSTGHETKSVH